MPSRRALPCLSTSSACRHSHGLAGRPLLLAGGCIDGGNLCVPRSWVADAHVVEDRVSERRHRERLPRRALRRRRRVRPDRRPRCRIDRTQRQLAVVRCIDNDDVADRDGRRDGVHVAFAQPVAVIVASFVGLALADGDGRRRRSRRGRGRGLRRCWRRPMRAGARPRACFDGWCTTTYPPATDDDECDRARLAMGPSKPTGAARGGAQAQARHQPAARANSPTGPTLTGLIVCHTVPSSDGRFFRRTARVPSARS